MTDQKDHADPNEPIELPAPKSDPGFEATDDLDPGVGDEHLRSPSQGVRPEQPTATERA
jgi:hypothetical protein